MRVLLASLVTALLATGVAGATAANVAEPSTRLVVAVDRDGPGPRTAVRWTLTCAPTGGTHPRAAAACTALARGGRGLFRPVPPETACTEIYGGPQIATVSGILDGRRLWARFRRDDGCQIDRWTRAGALLPRTS